MLLAFGMFVLGMAFHKYRFFPYELLRNTINKVEHRYGHPNEGLLRQYTRDIDKVAQDRDLDSALLPLRIKGVRISEHYPVPKVGGGITAIGDTVIVLDRLGNLYSSDSGGDNLQEPGVSRTSQQHR